MYSGANLGAAVCLFDNDPSVRGAMRFIQATAKDCVLDAVLDGLRYSHINKMFQR